MGLKQKDGSEVCEARRPQILSPTPGRSVPAQQRPSVNSPEMGKLGAAGLGDVTHSCWETIVKTEKLNKIVLLHLGTELLLHPACRNQTEYS